MKFKLTTDFSEITAPKPFTLQCVGGLGVEIDTGDTATKGNGITVGLSKSVYISENVRVWARALGSEDSKAEVNTVGF